MRRSVTIAVIRSAGVTSKAGLIAVAPSGVVRTPWNEHTSAAPRSSIGMWLPVGVPGSTVVSGATTRNGTPACAAASDSAKVPILLAVSPLAAIRSAPTTTASTPPRASVAAAAESTSTS